MEQVSQFESVSVMSTVRSFLDQVSEYNIRKEVQNCSRQLIEEFNDSCPVASGSDIFFIDVYVHDPAWGAALGKTELFLKESDPWPDFWKRWNRFYKLKAFW
jgi:hypothetical protein